MSIHNGAPITLQPELTLRPWVILECSNGQHYAMGWCVENHEDRASTAIEHFDRAKMQLRTRSGRVYQLEGPPGVDADGLYVWRPYATVNQLTVVRDATADYWPGWTGAKEIVDTQVGLIQAAILNAPSKKMPASPRSSRPKKLGDARKSLRRRRGDNQ